MSDIRRNILLFVRTYASENGYGPTVGEIAEAVGRSKSTAHHHLMKLRATGELAWQLGKVRTIRALAKPEPPQPDSSPAADNGGLGAAADPPSGSASASERWRGLLYSTTRRSEP